MSYAPKVEAMLPLRLIELQEVGIIGLPTENGELIELTNLTARNIKYIENNPNYGFKIEDGKYYLQTIFPDRPIGHTCNGLSFQPGVDISLFTDEDSCVEYLKLDNIYRQISPTYKLQIRDSIVRCLNNFNYRSVADVENAIYNRNFDFARALYSEFEMCDKKPQIVEKYTDEGIAIFSGARDVSDKIARLRSGDYPFTEQSTFGFGYYFSDSLHTPIRYANKIKENIIEARIDKTAKILTDKQLERVVPMLFDDMPTDPRWELASEVLQIPEFRTLATTALQHDCLQVPGNYGEQEMYYIPTNLDKVTMSNEPLFVNNMGAGSDM